MQNADKISWMDHSVTKARGGLHGRRLLDLHLPCECALVARTPDQDCELTVTKSTYSSTQRR